MQIENFYSSNSHNYQDWLPKARKVKQVFILKLRHNTNIFHIENELYTNKLKEVFIASVQELSDLNIL